MVLSTRADQLDAVFGELTPGLIPADVSLNIYPDVDSLDEKGLASEIALGAPDLLQHV